MSVSGITSGSSYNPADWQSSFSKVKSDYKSLAEALNSGNLSDAQQAYASLQKDLPAKSQSSATTAPGSSDPLSALGSALQAGNLSGAQQAMAALQQAHGAHHHRHHRASSDGANTAVAPATLAAPTTSTDTTMGLDAIA